MPVVSPDRTAPPPSPSSVANPWAPNGAEPTTLTAVQIGGYCYVAGFKGQSLVTAIAIALAESSGRTAANNHYTSGGITYQVWGLFQISTIHPEAAGVPVTQESATNPLTNCAMAYDLSGGGFDWRPWSTYTSGAFNKFIAIAQQAAAGAQAAAGSLPTGALGVGQLTGAGGYTAPAINPNEYAPIAKTSTYSKAVPVWRIEEIQMELVTADRKKLALAGLKSIVVGGGAGTTLFDLLVDAEVSLDNSQSTQVTLTFERGDVIATEGLGFPADPDHLISRVIIRDLTLAVSSASLVADAAGLPQWQIVCISEAQMALMDAFPPGGGQPGSVPGLDYAPGGGFDFSQNPNDTANPPDPTANSTTDPLQNPGAESADAYVNRMCQKFGITFYGETSNQTLVSGNTTIADFPGTANMAGYNPYGDLASGALPDSVWTYLQRLAGFFGFWVYETGGALYFAQPSTLVDWGNILPVNYKSLDSGVPVDGTEPIGTPQLSASIEEVPGGYIQYNKRIVVRQVSVQLAPWYGCQAKPGDQLVLSGFWNGKNSLWDTNPDAPDYWKGVGLAHNTSHWPVPDQKYIITAVTFKIDGGLSPVTIKAEEVRDPNPQITQDLLNQIQTNNPAGGDSGANVAYLTPSGIEAQVSANWQKDRFAADALKLAASQVGIMYKWGGVSPQTGFDCSGLVYWACLQVGVNPTNQPRTSQQLWSTILGAHRQMSVTDALNTPFALLFPADPASAPTHVAISVGDGKTILQASQTGEPIAFSPYNDNVWLVQAGELPTLDYSPPPGPAGQSPDLTWSPGGVRRA